MQMECNVSALNYYGTRFWVIALHNFLSKSHSCGEFNGAFNGAFNDTHHTNILIIILATVKLLLLGGVEWLVLSTFLKRHQGLKELGQWRGVEGLILSTFLKRHQRLKGIGQRGGLTTPAYLTTQFKLPNNKYLSTKLGEFEFFS